MNLGATIAMPTNLGTADRGTRIWPAAGITDMRKGLEGLAAIVEARIAQTRSRSNYSSFRGGGDRIKILRWSGDGLCSLA